MERGYYEELEDLKKEGKLFPFEKITFEQLEKLWWDEANSDSMIADLFDVDKRTVTNKRNDWDIKQSVYVAKETANSVQTMMMIYAQRFASDIIKEAKENKDASIEEIVMKQFRKHYAVKS